MPKKLKAFRLSEETTAILDGIVDKAGKKVSEAKTIEEWAKAYREGRIAMERAICDDALTQPTPEAKSKVHQVYSPGGTPIRPLVGLPEQKVSSRITDRTNAQPLTRAVQKHQVKE